MPEINRLTRPKPEQAMIDLGDGDTVSLVFDANKVTPRWMNATKEGAEQVDLLVLAKALDEVLISWDITDNGVEFPPTVDNIAVLSFPAVNLLFEEVCKAAAPGEAEGNASSPSANDQSLGSAQESEIFPNGSAASTSPSVLESQPSR
jgi:hypothetical protein